jgi:osmotically inducible protein OsmC
MALKRSSSVVWNGHVAKGSGKITTLSGALKDQPYSANARFQAEDGRAGTNPEELIAAAHAGCFTMALSAQLTNAGHEPTELRTTATVTMDKQDLGWTITGIALEVTGEVPGVSAEKFQELADTAKRTCPISRALAAVSNITMTAKLAPG